MSPKTPARRGVRALLNSETEEDIYEEDREKIITFVEKAAGPDVVASMTFVIRPHVGDFGPSTAFGRIDLARLADVPTREPEPLGRLAIISEAVPLDEFIRRLREGFDGKPFSCAGDGIVGHGMNARWEWPDMDHTSFDGWGATWPADYIWCRADPNASPPDPTHDLTGRRIYQGIADVFKDVGRFREFHVINDARAYSVLLVRWRYKGRIARAEQRGTRVEADVEPPRQSGFTLIMKPDDAPARGATKAEPKAGEVLDLPGYVGNVTLTLVDAAGKIDSRSVPMGRDEVERYAVADAAEKQSAHGAPAPPFAMAQRQFGGWVPGKQIGDESGQGVATLAHHPGKHQDGVLKILQPGLKEPAKARERFRREIEVSRRLTGNPFLIRMLDGDEDGDPQWVVFEHMTVGSLRERLPAYRGDVWRTLRLARDVASGLAALHDEAIVHRDVKPANIFLRTIDHAVVGDYGMAHDPARATVTATKERVRPYWFGPPEWEHGRVDDPKPTGDIYSLGKVIHTMLVGSLDFDKLFSREKFTADGYDLTKVIGPHLAPVNELLGKMIVEEPSGRLQTAADVITAIDELLGKMFGVTEWNRCIVCREGTYGSHVAFASNGGNGNFVTRSPGGAFGALDLVAEQCPRCGHVRLANSLIRNPWTTARKNKER